MKTKFKQTILLIMLFIILCLTSCDDETYIEPPIDTTKNNTIFEYTDNKDKPLDFNVIDGSDVIKYYNGYLYFLNGSTSLSKSVTLMKYNIKSNNLTCVCADPLCDHNTPDCPLYGLNNSYYIYNDNIYFQRIYHYMHRKPNGNPDYMEYFTGSCSYNFSDMKLTIYEQIENAEISDLGYTEYTSQLYTENYRYYYKYVYNESLENYIFSICRMDLNTKEIVVLDSDSNIEDSEDLFSTSLKITFLFHLNDRIYFTDGKTIYSTDFDMNDRQDVLNGTFIYSEIYTDGEYIYWGESEDSDNNILQTLYRAKLDGSGEKTSLGIKTEDWQITENYIYYLNPCETIIGKNEMEQRNGENIVLNNNEIRRTSHDGSSNEAVFSLIQDDTNFEIYQYTCVGNYIYAAYETYTDNNNDGAINDSEFYQSTYAAAYTILRIDVTTGDTYYIHCGTEDN